jgi:hypothetical protein
MTQNQDYCSSAQGLDAARNELKMARVLWEFSSTAYSKGNLQRAGDARSKAKLLCASAAERLTASGLDRWAADCIRSMLDGVRDAPAPE